MQRSRNQIHRRGPLLGAAAATIFACSAAAQLPGIELETYSTGFSRPVAFIQDPSNASVQYVVQQRGIIRVLVDGTLQADAFLNISSLVNQTANEGGLLGLAFPDDYGTDGRFYVNYTNPANSQTIIARYQRDPKNPLLADPSSAEILITVGQPFSNHNGGNMIFGMDGYLYIGLGDGGSGSDPGHRAQNPNTLLGKMLRIDVSPETGYAVPKDNPFLDGDPVVALDEIWAFGVRNPWRWSFDNWRLGGTGAMVMADVGQNAWEEINFEQPGDGGRNYGWRNREGANNHNTSIPPAYTPLIDPIHQYSHGSVGGAPVSSTGGYVYRGTRLGSPWRGRYFFAEYAKRRIWSFLLNQTGNGSISNLIEHTAELGGTGVVPNISSFGEDAEGELYIADLFGGTVRLIAPTETTDLVSVDPVWGSHVSGDVDDLRHSDGRYYVINSAFGFTALEANRAEIEVIAQTTATSPTLLDIVIQARINNPGGSAQVRVFNYIQNSFVLRASHAIGTTEEIFRFEDLSNPDRFVSSTGEVRVRSKHTVLATFSASGFRSRYDWIAIVVRD